jgi:fibronectin-binding autotransporter adhesin
MKTKSPLLRFDRLLVAIAIATVCLAPQLQAQTLYTSATNTGLWTSGRWSTDSNAVSFTNVWSNNFNVVFLAGTTYTFTGSGTTNIGNVTVEDNATVRLTGASGTLGTGGNVRTINVGSGALFDVGSQSISLAAGVGFIKTGAGVFALAGSAYLGGFTLDGGTVVARGTTAFGSATTNVLTLSNGVIAANGDRDFASTRFGGGIRLYGNIQFGALSNSYGTNAQPLISGTARLTFANNVDLGGTARTITIGNNGAHAFSGVISNGGLTIAAASGVTGTMTLSEANTYSGKTTINSGTLILSGSGTAGSTASDLEVVGGLLNLGNASRTNAAFTLSGGTITSGTLQATTYALQGGTILSSATLGTGTATVTTGTTTLEGLLNAATVNVNSGGLNLGAANRLADGAAVTIGGGTLGLGANDDEVGSFTMTSGTLGGSGTLTASTYALNGGTVAGNLGAGTINVGGNAALDGTAAATAINVNSGTLTLGSGSRFIGTTPSVTMAGGTLALGGAESIGSLGGSSGTVALGGNTLTVGAGDASSTYSSGITGSGGGVTKTGTGVLTLAANTFYTGATTINGGTLVYDGTNTSTAVAVNSGAVLAGSGSVGATTINSGGTMNPGNSPGTQTYASLTWEGGANYNWQLYDADGVAGTGYDTFVSTGAFTINSTSLDKFNINLWTLSDINPDVNGGALNFNTAEDFTWTLGTFGSISGFSADVFAINTFSTNGTGGFVNSFNGTFSINTNSTSLLLVYTAPVLGDEYDWSGGSGTWSTAGNWTNSAAPPATGAKIYFSGDGGNSTNNAVSTEVTGITFRTGAGAYVVEGDALSISNIGIANNSAALQTVTLDLTLIDNSIFNAAAGDLAIGGAIALGGNTLSIDGAENTDLSGIVSGTGGVTKTGAGSLTLGGNNTFSGTLAANDGTLLVGGTQATTVVNVGGGTLLLGANNLLADGATLTLSTGTVDLGAFSETVASFNQSGGVFTNGTLTATTYGLSGGTVGGTLSGGTANATGEVLLSGAINSTLNVNSGGTLSLASSDRLGNSSAVTVNAGTLATVTFNDTVGSLVLTNSGSITGSGTITAATYTLNGGTIGANLGAGAATASDGSTVLNGTLAGDLAVTGGTLTLGAADRIGDSSSVSISSGTLDFGGFSDALGSFSLSGGVFTNGTVTSATYSLSGGTMGGTLGAGTANISGAMILSGLINSTLNVNTGGTLTLAANDRIGNSSAVTIDAGTLATATFSDTAGSLVLTNNGALTGSGTLTATTYSLNGGTLDANLGTGTATASGGTTALNGTLAGNLTVSGGAVNLGSANRLADTANVTISSGTLGLANNIDTVGSFGITGGTLGGTGTLTAATYSLGGGTVNANLGAGTATASGDTTALNGTLAGNLTVSGGTVSLGSSDRLADASTVTLSSGTLAVGANTDTVGTLAVNGGTVSGSGTITASAFTAQGGTIETALAGVGATFTKSGTESVTLSAANTFDGGATIAGGAIIAANAAALGSGSVSMTRDGATLLASGAMTIANNISISAFQGYGADGGFIISEYVEGSSNNKYIELYNGTASSITLGDYRIALFANGSATATSFSNLGSFSGGPSTLAPGEALVLRNSSATLTLPSGVTSYVSGVTAFNGDDALALQSADGSVNIDIFGVIGNDPGSSWTAGSLSTADQTLTRDASVLVGVSVNPSGTGSSAFTTLGTQWTGYPIDTVSNLGSHFMNAGAGTAVLGSEVADAAVTFSGAISLTTPVQMTAASGGNTEFVGTLSGAGVITKTGTGTVTLSGNNTYSGGTTLSTGVLRLQSTTGAGTGDITQPSGASTLVIDTAGTISNDMSVYNVAFLDGATLSGAITVNNATFDVVENETSEISGVVDGEGGVTKTGLGQLTLSGNNTYTGATTVNAGVLELASTVGGAAALTSEVNVAGNAVLLISQSNQVNNSAAVSLSGGTITRGTGVSEVFGSLSIDGNSFLDFGSGTSGTMSFGVYEGGATPSALLTVNNFFGGNTLTFGTDLSAYIDASYNGTTFTSEYFAINSISGGFTSGWNSGSSTFTITAIPEPSTYAAAIGLLGLMLWPSRKRLIKDAKKILGLTPPMRERLARRGELRAESGNLKPE